MELSQSPALAPFEHLPAPGPLLEMLYHAPMLAAPEDTINFCNTVAATRTLCNDWFWRAKLQRDFPLLEPSGLFAIMEHWILQEFASSIGQWPGTGPYLESCWPATRYTWPTKKFSTRPTAHTHPSDLPTWILTPFT